MQKMVISNRIYTERGCLDGALLVEDDKIKRLYTRDHIPSDYLGTIEDYGNDRILPGIIEMHVRDFKGWSALSCDVDEIRSLGKALSVHGVTGFTPIKYNMSKCTENIAALVDAYEGPRYGARNLGIHMKLLPVTKGSSGMLDVRTLDFDSMKKLYETSHGHIKAVTITPECPFHMELLDWLVKRGVNPCIEQFDCKKVFDQSACKMIDNPMQNNVFQEINSDLSRYNTECLMKQYHKKGYEKLCLVAGNGDEDDRDGLLIQKDRSVGDTFSVMQGIHNLVEVMGIPLEEAVVMASLNPAKLYRVDQQKGSIKEGKDADYVVIDDNYRVRHTVVEGTIEYDDQNGYHYDKHEHTDY